jgi:hypothetical protein
MNRKNLTLIAATSVFVLSGAAAIAAEKTVSAKIESRVKEKLPSASGISASMPILDIPSNLKSDSIKAININIDEYKMKGSNRKTSLEIHAKNINKSGPTQIGSLDITTTIPAETLLQQSTFEGAEIVENALQVSVGAGGLGKALLVPKFANNQIYFQLQSVSLLGTPIPAESLPADIQEQIKSRSVKSLTVPEGLEVKSVFLSPKGLSVNFQGTDIKLGNLTL